MEYELNWEDIIEYLRTEYISDSQKRDAISELGGYEIEFDDVIEYLRTNSLSSSEEEDILDEINHECDDLTDEHGLGDKYLKVETLEDEFKFETIEKLYYSLSSQQLEKIEKMVELKVI